MSSIMKVDIQKFDGEISFNLWKVQIRAVLIQHGLWKVLSGAYTKPNTMTMGGTEEEEAWFFDGLRMGGIGGKDTDYHTVMLSVTCLMRGA